MIRIDEGMDPKVTGLSAPSGFKCPCCLGTQGLLHRTVTAEESATQQIRPWGDSSRHAELAAHIRRLWDSDYCSLVRCTACGATTSYPFVAGDMRFYDLAYGHTDRYPSNKWEYREALAHLLGPGANYRPNLRVLEIGAGRGAFLRKLVEGGVSPSGLAAVEYSALGRSALQDLGLGYVSDHSLDQPSLPQQWSEGFDVIALFQVLEHLDNLDRKLDLLTSCLRTGGNLIVAVPNIARTDFNEANGAFLDQPPNHITRFTQDALKALAERAGLKVVHCQPQPSRHIFDFASFHYFRYLRRSQKCGTIAARIAAQPNARTRRAAIATYLLLSLPKDLPAFPRVRYGSALLTVLQRDSDRPRPSAT